jgi:signal transduction histidine kinase
MTVPRRPSRASAGHSAGGALLVTELTVSVICALVVLIVWAVTGGPFWPGWAWLGLAVPLALNAGTRRAWSEPAGPRRRLAVHATVSGIVGAAVIVAWVLTGDGTFWPVYPLLGLGAAVGLHAATDSPRRRELAGRVDELTRTRRGVLDVQAAELRRIERDLHDGAQARLVALSIVLGRAEARLEDRPEEAELVRRAREEATAAIGELRDLARGIAPPVLADRGLAAAVQALADRAPVAVAVDAAPGERPPLVVETAAYFVVAEALTNAVKHGAGAGAHIGLARSSRALTVEVSDHGPGGADPAGGGLTGLRQRVEAIDGVLDVHSPAGHGTTVTAVLPCEW